MVVEREVRRRQIEFERLSGVGEMERAGLRQVPAALFEQIGDVFAVLFRETKLRLGFAGKMLSAAAAFG